MICVSIAESSASICLKALGGQSFAEIRLDSIASPSASDVKRIFSAPCKLVATCRATPLLDDDKREALLLAAIEAGAAYVDIEVDASDAFKQKIVAAAKQKGCKIIASFHDHKKTPVEEELKQIVQWCFESGAEIAKIACKANSERDAARLLGLLDDEKKLIVIGMGEKGKVTRVIAPLLGSQFTYASLKRGKETAEGQMTKEEIEKALRAIEDAA